MSIEQYGSEMDDDDVFRFLERQGLGTLAFGNDTGGYAIPMSFGYDRSKHRCIFQFSFGDDSTKSAFIEEDIPVALSTYEWTAVTDWKSVVIRGILQQIPDEKSAQAAGIFAAHANVASLEVFRQSLQELDFGWYELQIDDIHGRQAASNANRDD